MHSLIEDCLHKLRHFLPSQAPLKDFVHHNSLHSFQDYEFFDGIFTASKIFGYKVTFNINTYRKLFGQGRIKLEIMKRVIVMRKGIKMLDYYQDKMINTDYRHRYDPRVGQLRSRWKDHFHIDLDNLVQPLLFRILASYLDQGIALWNFPFVEKGLIGAIRMVEKNSFTSFFTSKRARQLLYSKDLSIEYLLKIVVGNPAYYGNYLFDQQFTHKGWSGMVCSIEGNQESIFYKKSISLEDLIILELLLEIDALDRTLGKNWQPIASSLTDEAMEYFSVVKQGELEEIMQLWHESFEWTYYDEVLSAVGKLSSVDQEDEPTETSFQAMFCIDDRECSIRRHIENVDEQCETLGAPGFFGAAIYFQPFGAKFYDKNCPVALTPKHLIKEIEIKKKRSSHLFHSQKTHTLFTGFMLALSMGLMSGFRMLSDLLNPKMQPDISDAFAHMDIQGKLLVESSVPVQLEKGLQVGYQIHEMVDIVESMLKGIGLTKDFASIVYVVAHGSSSANNPHHGAHDCGACSGRPGAVNARVFADMANHKKVRAALVYKGIVIPNETHFLAAMHDTSSDEIAYYDEEYLSHENVSKHVRNKEKFETALDKNAKERARRFASIDSKRDINHIRKEIKKRAVSYFEPRPELGHGTNALCHVGSRKRIKGLFLDRRAFLQSYDYESDPDGTRLSQVLGPLPAVCGGINLEYYFSRMDTEKMGAGTKLPHNVTGLIGVTNSTDGDLRTGLPLQMIENHDPVRLLMLIEHRPEIILKVIQSSPSMYNWFDKGWLHLVAISPDDNKLYHFKDGSFELYTPLSKVKEVADIEKVIHEGLEMSTNHILDATKENIATHIYPHKRES